MKIGIVGCGKMVTAVTESLFKSDSTLDFITFSKTFKSAQSLASKLDGKAIEHLSSMGAVDYLFIGCKPQQFKQVAKEIKEQLNLDSTTIVSILAGTSVLSISKELASNKIIRLMPSMPIKEDMGISLFYFSESIQKDQQSNFVSMFNKSSKNFILDTQKQFDQITTISSSGAAYVYFLTSIFADKLKEFGLDEDASKEMAVQLFLGSSKLMSNSSDSLQAMIDAVTSKEGVTIEAIDTFKDMNLRAIVDKGIENAFTRSQELSKLS